MTQEGQRPNDAQGRTRPVVYCLVPPELADRLHEPLRRHFRDDPEVEVVVERRLAERRGGRERRKASTEAKAKGKAKGKADRRRLRSAAGRRGGERRASLVPIKAPELPRRARAHADRLVFVQRLEPSTLDQEDRDTMRLVARAQAGDGNAFSVLYKRYFARVYGYLKTVVRDHHESEDLAQEVFTHVFAGLPTYEQREVPFRHWLFSIVRNEAMSFLRRQGRIDVEDPAAIDRRREDLEAEEPELGILGWIADRDLSLFVERMPVHHRQILTLRYLLGLPHKEVAQVLDRTPADVKAQHHRAMLYLRERLAAVGKGPAADTRKKAPSSAVFKPAEVLRHRRFALYK